MSLFKLTHSNAILNHQPVYVILHVGTLGCAWRGGLVHVDEMSCDHLTFCAQH
jgi:hypothetical protein